MADAQAARPYKQEPGSPPPAPPAPPAPGLPTFPAAPGTTSCPDCGKASLKPAHLLRHRQSHSGEKPHACPECGKAFRRKEHLRRHRGTHPGGPGPALRPLPAREKPHACCECGKTFYWREHLVRHRKTHSGARPFACWQCGKGFGRREHVLRHQRPAPLPWLRTPVPEPCRVMPRTSLSGSAPAPPSSSQSLRCEEASAALPTRSPVEDLGRGGVPGWRSLQGGDCVSSRPGRPPLAAPRTVDSGTAPTG